MTIQATLPRHSISALLNNAAIDLAATTDTPRFEAELLLGHILGKPRSHFHAWPEHPVDTAAAKTFHRHLQRRLAGEPIAYITGSREFWSMDFEVTPDTLIPRPETEVLVEHTLALLRADKPLNIADLGTGSGAIAVALGKERPAWRIVGCDISPAAILVAKRNARRHHVSNVTFAISDWFSKLDGEQFDAIVANPPYIAPGDPHLRQGDLRFEPPTALSCANSGLAALHHIGEAAGRFLRTGGWLIMEHGYNQAAALTLFFENLGYKHITNHRDISGIPRAISARAA